MFALTHKGTSASSVSQPWRDGLGLLAKGKCGGPSASGAAASVRRPRRVLGGTARAWASPFSAPGAQGARLHSTAAADPSTGQTAGRRVAAMASIWDKLMGREEANELFKKNGRTFYAVKPGDTLWGIGKRFGTTVEILMQANKLNDTTIAPGQELWVPRTYAIEKGDTLLQIAQEYGTSLEEILSINRIQDPDKIKEGDIMLLP